MTDKNISNGFSIGIKTINTAFEISIINFNYSRFSYEVGKIKKF